MAQVINVIDARALSGEVLRQIMLGKWPGWDTISGVWQALTVLSGLAHMPVNTVFRGGLGFSTGDKTMAPRLWPF